MLPISLVTSCIGTTYNYNEGVLTMTDKQFTALMKSLNEIGWIMAAGFSCVGFLIIVC